MKFSHSKLSTVLKCPATYYLNYVAKISPIEVGAALQIGSAVHYGIEHKITDLTQYWKDNSPTTTEAYTDEQLLSEAMIHGYMNVEADIFSKLLTDENGERLELLDDPIHELDLEVNLNSHFYSDTIYEFRAIIDLLLLTEKGWIIVDYKTSSKDPDYDSYLDQLYKYEYALKREFPEVPIYRVAVINIKKTKIRQKKNENKDDFRNRLRLEYYMDDGKYINYHIFNNDVINPLMAERYILNLKKTLDGAKAMIDSKNFFINYSNVKGMYGPSKYYDIFYQTPNAHLQFKTADDLWDEEAEEFVKSRDCVPIDMQVLDREDIMRNYNTFYEEVLQYYDVYNKIDKEGLFDQIKENYLTDDRLLERYWITFVTKLELENES